MARFITFRNSGGNQQIVAVNPNHVVKITIEGELIRIQITDGSSIRVEDTLESVVQKLQEGS
jgi:hypothetical protein